MGVSRSASTVIAYAMKEYSWSLEKAYNFVKQKRSITRPNASFMRQLAEYEGILDARYKKFLFFFAFASSICILDKDKKILCTCIWYMQCDNRKDLSVFKCTK